jgi:hypothetical protein
MKKIYVCFLLLFIAIGFTSAQEKILWDFDTWEALPANNPADGENWRGTSNGSIALTDSFPFGTTSFNYSKKAIELKLTGDDGGLVFEGIAPPFDRSKYNAVSFYVYAPGTAQWEFEMMNTANGNRFKGIVKTDSTTVNDWYEMIFEIPITVAADLTKFVMKPRKPVELGSYYIDDITFFKIDRPAPTEIVINNPIPSMMVGKEHALALGFAPEVSDKEIEFMSTKPDVATVSISGVVKGIAPGTVEIKATSQKDPLVSATLNLTIVAQDPASTYTAFNFEAHDYVPSHSAYTCEIVDNPLKDGVNSSDKVLKLDVSGAWQWMTWDYTQNTNDVEKMTFKIFSETEITAFNLEVGTNGAGSKTIASLEAGKWTLITVDLKKYVKDDMTIYVFTKDKWNTGTIYMDDIMYVVGDGASYVPVSGVGKLTGGTITNMDGKHTMATPEISPADATNKNLVWSIVSSDPADAATINPKTGEISALLNGEIKVTARTRDLMFHTDTVAVVIAMVDDTSISNPTVNAVRLYPNPAKDVVYLSSHINIEQVRVYNIAGQLMLNAYVNDNQFDISSLIRGIYLVEVIAADNVRSMSKLVVK